MAMTREQMTKLLEVVDAKIAEAMSRDSSDGGLTEHIRMRALERELENLCPPADEDD